MVIGFRLHIGKGVNAVDSYKGVLGADASDVYALNIYVLLFEQNGLTVDHEKNYINQLNNIV